MFWAWEQCFFSEGKAKETHGTRVFLTNYRKIYISTLRQRQSVAVFVATILLDVFSLSAELQTSSQADLQRSTSYPGTRLQARAKAFIQRTSGGSTHNLRWTSSNSHLPAASSAGPGPLLLPGPRLQTSGTNQARVQVGSPSQALGNWNLQWPFLHSDKSLTCFMLSNKDCKSIGAMLHFDIYWPLS